MTNFYCEICGEVIDPEDPDVQDGVHSHCDTSGVDSSVLLDVAPRIAPIYKLWELL